MEDLRLGNNYIRGDKDQIEQRSFRRRKELKLSLSAEKLLYICLFMQLQKKLSDRISSEIHIIHLHILLVSFKDIMVRSKWSSQPC